MKEEQKELKKIFIEIILQVKKLCLNVLPKTYSMLTNCIKKKLAKTQ